MLRAIWHVLFTFMGFGIRKLWFLSSGNGQALWDYGFGQAQGTGNSESGKPSLLELFQVVVFLVSWKEAYFYGYIKRFDVAVIYLACQLYTPVCLFGLLDNCPSGRETL